MREQKWSFLVVLAALGCEAEPASEPPAVDPLEAEEHLEPALEVSREFECDPSGVGSEMIVDEREDTPGEQLLIRPSGTPCNYHLVHRDSDGTETVLSPRPGGYLIALSLPFPRGDRLVCASNIVHRSVDGTLHESQNVTLECTARRAGSWSPLATVVDPGGQWAAWLREMRVTDPALGEAEVQITHDFSFQFMNLGDEGRPVDDGVYAFGARLSAGGLSVSELALVTRETNPIADGEAEEWIPTEQEREELGDVIDFDGTRARAGDAGPPDGGISRDAG